MNYAIRVSMPYADCSGVLSLWSSRSQAAIVYEHEADSEVNRTHVHLGLYGCTVKAEALKRMWKEAPGQGNGFWSFKEADRLGTAGFLKYVGYMDNGSKENAPKMAKNISPALVDEAKGRWVTESPDPKPAKSKSKQTQKEDLYEIVNEISTRYTKEVKDDTTTNYTEFIKITDIAIQVLEEKRKRYNMYDFQRYVIPVMNRDKFLKEDFQNAVYKNIFRNN